MKKHHVFLRATFLYIVYHRIIPPCRNWKTSKAKSLLYVNRTHANNSDLRVSTNRCFHHLLSSLFKCLFFFLLHFHISRYTQKFRGLNRKDHKMSDSIQTDLQIENEKEGIYICRSRAWMNDLARNTKRIENTTCSP